MRSAVVRRSSGTIRSEPDSIDEVDSPIDELNDGTLSIKTNGRSVEDIWQRPTRRPLPDDGTLMLRFEIPYARVLPPTSDNSSIKKYVIYDVNVRLDSSVADQNPTTIERRYTQFLTLYENLKKDFPQLMQNVSFPKKVLVGNFSTDLIAERSAAFEIFLDYIVTVSALRESKHFLSFLEDLELTKSCQLLDERRNEMAVPILENTFRLLNKIYMDRSTSVLLVLCRLVTACTSSPIPHPLAEKYAELAIRRFEGVSDTELLSLYIPLLQTCSYLWWQRGKDNNLIEERLKDFEIRGMKVKGGLTLAQALHKLDPRAETI